MKTFLLMVMSGCLLMAGCKNKPAPVPVKADTATVKGMTIDARTEKVDALKKLAPFGLEDMQKLMPAISTANEPIKNKIRFISNTGLIF